MPKAPRSTSPQLASVRYQVRVLNPHAHLFDVVLDIDRPAATQTVSLPVWIPGSYLVREFSQHLQGLQASCDGAAVATKQLNKNTWQVRCPKGTTSLRLHYQVYAFDASVRTSWLTPDRAFFNGTSLCLRVHGREAQPHSLQLLSNTHTHGWQVATGLPTAKVSRSGFGTYLAAHYDELVDCPVEMGAFWSGQFKVRGITHRFVVSGALPGFDGERLLRDTQRIVEAAHTMWHGPSKATTSALGIDRYVFMLNATADGYGGLEHRNSTALICQRSDLPQALPAGTQPPTQPAELKATDGYTTLLGLISHEYFHTWNVKRLRPAEFAQYDYNQENHTQLLWLFEGFTSYYDDLLLHRAGLIDADTHLQLIARNINQVHQTPGRLVQTVAQASFDAWTRYYRIQENTPNATVSYYTKGALVALCLDLTLRAEGHTTLDAVMRALWQRTEGGPMTEADLLQVLKQLGKRSFAAEIAQWVHSTTDLPVQALLQNHGVQVTPADAPLAQSLGLRVSEANGIVLKNVLRGSVAEAAGMAAGDEWLGLDITQGEHTSSWRLRKLDDAAQLLRGVAHQGAYTLHALVARDGRIHRLPLQWPATAQVVRLKTSAQGLGPRSPWTHNPI
jgi:predicted metalloprotease with PDZ domain